MKLATCNEPWRDTPIEEVFQTAARLGFDGVELAPFTLAEDVRQISAGRRNEIRRAAADAGVAIVGVHWLFVAPKGLHLTTPDPAVRRESSTYLGALADFCADVGGNVMILGSPKQRSVEPPTTQEEAWKRARDVLAGCTDCLADRGVYLAFEALSPKETNFINTAEQAVRLAEEVAHPNVGIMLDTKAVSSMPDPIEETIRRFGARALHFHANEPSGKGAGMPRGPEDPPHVDFAPILKALAATGYDRWVSLEPFDYNPDPTTVAEVGLKTLKAALPK
jgi:sugar phosphate isomerase/epimerase